jgi:putative ABC transport system permease protein
MRPDVELGLRLLVHDKRRLLAISASIAVGVIIMFVEFGLLQGILDSQALVARATRGDLMVMNSARVDLHRWDAIDRVELAQITAVRGVASVIPVYEDHVGFTDPDDKRVRRMIVYAFSPDTLPLAIGDPRKISAALRGSNGFLFDARSRPIFGRIRPGMNIDVDEWPLTVSGLASMGPDIVNDGNIFVSEGTWLARKPDANPIMGVVRLAPGASVEAVRQRIYAQTPSDIVALTPAEAAQRETLATLKAAPIGLLFGIGVIAGMVIGAINGYQVLYTEVSDHMAQYATLKAMGVSDRFLHGAILAQAMALSGVGFALGLPTAILIELYVAHLTKLPVQPHLLTGLLVAAATVASCVVAGRLATRRVDVADPASLY